MLVVSMDASGIVPIARPSGRARDGLQADVKPMPATMKRKKVREKSDGTKRKAKRFW